MHSLDQIIRLNNKAAAKAETNFDRHCSFSGTAQDGVVLHSAKLRNTVLLSGSGGKLTRPSAAGKFLVQWWSCNSQEKRDALVESYFI